MISVGKFTRSILLCFTTASIAISLPNSATAKNVGIKKCNAYTQEQYGNRFDSKTPIIKATLEPSGSGYLLKILLKGGENMNILLSNKLIRQKTSEDNLIFTNYDTPISIEKNGSFSLANSFNKYVCEYAGKLIFLNGSKAKIFK
jgi:hypothetical protein